MEFLSIHSQRLPDEIQLSYPPRSDSSHNKLDLFIGSMIGLATGDALGASSEFRPHEYFVNYPIKDMEGGGTWGLRAGQWTDDTSMALCLAASLITMNKYDPYNQMVRYKRWYEQGYLSSTGRCFDIGNATRDSLEQFKRNQIQFSQRYSVSLHEMDNLSWEQIKRIGQFEVNCSSEGVAGNGALMRLAPIPLFFYRHPKLAVEYAGQSGRLTHGDRKAIDACRYYSALIVAALNGSRKEDILKDNFYQLHLDWFSNKELHKDIKDIAEGSYKRKNGYEGGIRGTGYIVKALEAALWAFYSTNTFEEGALAAVNLGDDTDTTAAIYGQLAGAFYRYRQIPPKWTNKIYAHDLIDCISQWLSTLANQYNPNSDDPLNVSSNISQITNNYSHNFNQNKSNNYINNDLTLQPVISGRQTIDNQIFNNYDPMNINSPSVYQNNNVYEWYGDSNQRRRSNASQDYNRITLRQSTGRSNYLPYPYQPSYSQYRN